MIKLSIATALAVSIALAGGDISPIESTSVVTPPIAVNDCHKSTTIAGKLQGYYYTWEGEDLFKKESSQLATAATLDISHTFFDGLSANFTAVGYTNVMNKKAGYLEEHKDGAFFNVANLTASFWDTTLIAGRQLIDSPMFGSFDWLLAPSAFEAYTVINKSITNLTLVGTYVTKIRPNNTGDNFLKLTNKEDGDQYALGANYATDAFNASLWYYNIDVADYTQVYGDVGYDFGTVSVAGQVASTNYKTGLDSMAYAAKISTKISNINLMAALSSVSDKSAGLVERDNFYTSSWNTFASSIAIENEDTLSWKLGASAVFSDLNTEISYAGYGDDGSEFDFIVGYDVTKNVNFGAIFTSTTQNVSDAKAFNALEVIGTYTF